MDYEHFCVDFLIQYNAYVGIKPHSMLSSKQLYVIRKNSVAKVHSVWLASNWRKSICSTSQSAPNCFHSRFRRLVVISFVFCSRVLDHHQPECDESEEDQPFSLFWPKPVIRVGSIA